MSRSIDDLRLAVSNFSAQRGWEKFHSPRNLVLALVGEVGELAAEFQWISDSELDQKRKDPEFLRLIGSELADVMTYLVRLADVLNLNIEDEVLKKLAVNEARYPADRARGSSAKYTAYE